MVGPDYKKPVFNFPEFWHAKPAAKTEVAAKNPEKWWESFHDKQLDDLVQQALKNNENLKTAAERVVEARGLRESTASTLFPQVKAEGQAQRGNEGFQTFNGNLKLYQADFDASYEIDLFGGNRRAVQAQNANLRASIADYQDVTISLVAEVAREYVTLRELQQQLVLARETAKVQEQLLDLTRSKNKAGIVSTLDVSQAEMLYKTTTAAIPDLERQIAASANRLSVLLGAAPGKVDPLVKETAAIPVPDKLVAIDSPVDVINRRPDVKRAEQELIAATAMHGVAISDLYPKISISALLGVQNASLSSLALKSHGKVWSIGTNASETILDFGKIQGEINAADSRQQQAFHQYRQTVIVALDDVDTALVNVDKENQRRLLLLDAVKSAEHALAMARVRYQQGLSNFNDVLQSEQQLYTIQNDLILSEGTSSSDVIALYKELGLE